MALVTGASAGIGWSTCELLAEAGMRVVAVARRRERLEALQQHLVSRGVPIADFLPVVCDITKVRFAAHLCAVQSMAMYCMAIEMLTIAEGYCHSLGVFGRSKSK